MPFIILGIVAAIVLIIIFATRSRPSGGGGRAGTAGGEKKPEFWGWTFTPEYKRVGIRGEEAATRSIESILHEGDRLFTNVSIEYDGKPAELDNVIVNKYGYSSLR